MAGKSARDEKTRPKRLGGRKLQGFLGVLLWMVISSAALPAGIEEYRFPAVTITFDQLDFSGLGREAARLFPGMDPIEIRRYSERSFQDIYFKKINPAAFVTLPAPESILAKIETILKAQKKLGEQLKEGTRVIVAESPTSHQLRVVRGIRSTATLIYETFRNSFLDSRSRYSATLCKPEDDLSQFSLFLQEVRKIHALLSKEITRYFFPPEPATVSLHEIDDALNIEVLTEVLVELSEVTEESLLD